MRKIFNQKNFNNFVGTPWIVEVTHIYIFAFKFTLRYLQPDIIPIVCHRFATGLPPVLLTPVAKLPPVSTTLVKLVAKFAASVVDTGGNFATSVVDTGGNFAPGVVDTGGNLPPVSLIPVVKFEPRISPRIFEKIRNGPNGVLRGLGETDS
jgi:hypothetical protein